MRLQSLELIRYGHFTGQALVFPRSNCDFHLVVGANEAGKSTLRRAVSELLFGMPLRSEMGFRHPLAELRLGAAIESAAGTLAFHRARGRRSLRRPDDGALADTALAEHLGGTTAGLFERMFCLDLAGLLEGGQTILDARDDVGQLLFQSAAGLSSLGRLRDALAAEADGLYAPRRSGSRAFYTALDAYEAARQALRGATVPTRAWTAAQDEVQRLDTATAEAAARYRDLSAQRQRLERLRRIAPRVAQLRDLLAQQTASAGLPLLPEDAAQRLAEGEVTLATQTSRADLLRQTGQALQTQEAALTDDDAILALADAVEALAAQAQACVHHPRDIGRREEEVQARLRQAASAGAELGWPADEAALRSRRPSSLALKAVSALMQQHGALRQARRSTEEALERARALLARWQPASVPPRPEIADGLVTGLQAALREAQPLQAGSGRLSSLQAAVVQTRQQLDVALAALGTWRMEPAALAALPLPSEERLAMLKAERADLAAGLQAARQQLTQAQEAARRSALALAQFTAAQQVVTPDDVREARAARDRLWAAIKSRQAALAEAAAGLDHAIERADELVDRQRDQASQSAQLVSLRQALDRDDAAAQAASRHAEAAAARLADFESQWDLQASACGLPGMPLFDLSGWGVNRRAVLEAAATLADRTGELTALQQAESRAAAALAQALCACGVATPAPSALAALCSRAEQWLADRQAERAQDAARSEQLAQAQAELDYQTQQWQRCGADLALWNTHWLEALQAASLPAHGLSPETALAAIERVEQVRDLLHEIDELRVQRIQTMQRDLADFSRSAQALRLALGEPEAVAASADEGFAWARALWVRLQRAREMRRERDRLQAARRDNDAALQAAEAAQAATRAALAPLHALAHTTDATQLRERIAASDRLRRIDADLHTQRQAIVEAGDGLTLEALLAEHDAASPQTLKSDLEALDGQLAELVELRNRLSVELSQARSARERIHGGDEAAQAESKRLEALAQLGETAERYLQVATGHRLLRWAVDRYRERQQGPLLRRASALFAQLTLDGFARLTPDFEVTPPRLIALRSTGERVPIEGLSEGTRDQLFLALRLAALEMHIDADRPLPFIADDLFVNFHDARSRAGLAALGELARRTQVIFLTHHEHLVEVAHECVGRKINVVRLEAG